MFGNRSSFWFGGARARILGSICSITFYLLAPAAVLATVTVPNPVTLTIVLVGRLASFEFALLEEVVLGDQRNRTTLRASLWRSRFSFGRESCVAPCEASAGSTRCRRHEVDRLEPRPVGILWVDETGRMGMKDEALFQGGGNMRTDSYRPGYKEGSEVGHDSRNTMES
jgi:hypothetical protein